jgi:hypothetical protein
VYKLQTGICCIFDERDVLLEAELIGKTKKVEKSL